jgi:predicted amidophosphoribosyltransferase
LGDVLARALAELVALAIPPVCLACRSPLARPTDALCTSCRRALPWLAPARCPRCALPAPCGRCPAAGAAFERAWAPLSHDGPARALVAALKFRAMLAAAETMAAQIAAGAPDDLLRGVLVPVPAHPGAARRRGFDQAESIAGALARRTGQPVMGVLARTTGAATPQVGAGARLRRAPGRVGVTARAPVPRLAVLVDDVHTTGATLDACARALRDAGAEAVGALTYTRTLPR